MKIGFRGRLVLACAIASCVCVGLAGYIVSMLSDTTERAHSSLAEFDEFAINHGRALQSVGQTQEIFSHLDQAVNDATATGFTESINSTLQGVSEALAKLLANPLSSVQADHSLKDALESASKDVEDVKSFAQSIGAKVRQSLAGDAAARAELSRASHGDLPQLTGLHQNLMKALAASSSVIHQVVGESRAELDRTKMRTLVALASTMVLLLVGGLFFSHRVTVPLSKSVSSLEESSRQIRDSAVQVSAVSQSLASSAAEQAASIEETTASVKEIADMTSKNAQSASAANTLATETRQSVESGRTTVGELVKAMEQINAASSEITKIIKVIDEIAFQTNMLALNAAVEAARAGEVGMGFAVVAEEVRKLAQRCSQAAKDTEVKIQESIHRSVVGADLTQKVSKSLDDMLARVYKLDELMGAIADASRRQAEGAEQTNAALGQIERATQQTASAAEEAAASGDKLASEAAQILSPIDSLRGILHGGAVATPVPDQGWKWNAPPESRPTGGGLPPVGGRHSAAGQGARLLD